MSITASFRKKELRQELRDKLAGLSRTIREHGSAQACALLRQQTIWKKARSVFVYSPLPSELDISPLIPEALKEQKIVLLPKFDPETESYLPFQITHLESDLLPGKFGINEPNGNCPPYPLNQLDLILVPALAFDPLGARLGRGRGFYDKLLAQVSGLKCGVGYDEQIVPHIPIEPHDVSVDCVLTPTRWLQVPASPKPE